MNPELWKEVSTTLKDYENRTGVQIRCDWRLDKKQVNEGPVTKAEITETIPLPQIKFEQQVLIEDPSSLEIFQAIQGPVNKDHAWFIEDPEVEWDFLDGYLTQQFQQVEPFFVGTFTDDEGKEQGQPNVEVVPFVPEFFKTDERFTNAEKYTNYDSGLIALCAVSAQTPEKQAALFRKYTNLILSIHEESPKLLANWLKVQQESEPYRSYTTFFKNDHVVLDSGGTNLKPVEERLVVLDDFEETWKERIKELSEALENDMFMPYHLRWIEFLSHSTDIRKIHTVFRNVTQINEQYQKSQQAKEPVKAEVPERPVKVIEPEKVSERVHTTVIDRTPGGLRTLALVGLVGAAALWFAFCRPQPEFVTIPGTSTRIEVANYRYENPDTYFGHVSGIMDSNLSSVIGRCEGNWAVENGVLPRNFNNSSETAAKPYHDRVASMSSADRNAHRSLISKCVDFITHTSVNPASNFETKGEILAKHKNNGVTNTFKEPKDFKDFFLKAS
jgi:hypothetical protein